MRSKRKLNIELNQNPAATHWGGHEVAIKAVVRKVDQAGRVTGAGLNMAG
jgi:hypothetical protein